MAKILGIITAFVLAISAFVAMKNNARLKDEIANKEKEEKALAVTRKRLTDAQEKVNALPEKFSLVENQTAEKLAEEEQLIASTKELKSQIDSKKLEIAANEQNLEKTRASLNQVGNIEELASKVKNMKVELAELEQTIDSRESQLANLTDEKAKAEQSVSSLRTEVDVRSKGGSLASLNTRIKRVYPNWGFVTLVDGYDAGVGTGSELDIVRGGKVIGRLLVTSVERRGASASIIPNSISEDVVLQVGDQVVPRSGDSN